MKGVSWRSVNPDRNKRYVGIDDIYSGMPNQSDEALGNAFDITWLTIVCIKLAEIKNGHRPQVRLRVKAQNKSGT